MDQFEGGSGCNPEEWDGDGAPDGEEGDVGDGL